MHLLAMAIMFIDHVGAYLFPDMIMLRVIGHMGLPIFWYLMVSGYKRTRSLPEYLVRILAVAIAAQPIMLWMGATHVNAVFGFFGSMGILVALDHEGKRSDKKALYVSSLIMVALSGYGFMTLFLFLAYRYGRNEIECALMALVAIIVCSTVTGHYIHLAGIVGVLLIYLWGTWDIKMSKGFRYAFYPGHLFIIGLLKTIFF